MPPDAEHVAVLRVVVREDFSGNLAERLVKDISRVLEELDELPARLISKTTHVTAVKGEDGPVKKSTTEVQREITSYWKRLVERQKTSGVC